MSSKKHRNQRGKRKFSYFIKGSNLLLGFSLLLFLETMLLDYGKAHETAERLYYLVKAMVPFLLIVFVLMVLVNLFVRTTKLVKYMGENSGIKGWLIALVAGNISVGNIYFWFPMLKEMKDKGVRPDLIASFLFNRGIKLTWLPVMVLVFGKKYVLVLFVVTTVVSILQGIIIDLLMKKDKPSTTAPEIK